MQIPIEASSTCRYLREATFIPVHQIVNHSKGGDRGLVRQRILRGKDPEIAFLVSKVTNQRMKKIPHRTPGIQKMGFECEDLFRTRFPATIAEIDCLQVVIGKVTSPFPVNIAHDDFV